LFQFEDDPDKRLVSFAVDLYRRSKRKEDADKLLWQTFERSPDMEFYRKLKATAADDPAAVEVRDKVIGLLQAQLGRSRSKRWRWSSPAELLIEIMMSERMFAEAWGIARVHGCNEHRLVALAEASEESHPLDALKVHAQRVERLASSGGNDNYRNACQI